MKYSSVKCLRLICNLLFLLTVSVQAETNNIFLNSVQGKFKHMPESKLEQRLLKEYGSLWINNNSVLLPNLLIFPSETETLNYQNKLKLAKFSSTCALQEPAFKALQKAQQIAQSQKLSVSQRGTDSCLRSYKTTQDLWLSRVKPNLDYYVQNGKISTATANQIKNLKTPSQIEAILKLEQEKNLSFDKYRQGSILNSVAAPGSSQHLTGLAFDLAEFNNPQVRKIMNQCGWWQTVKNDLPHFTYLGLQYESDLQKSGLKQFKQAGFTFWIPNF